ncbi:MAG: hypothetical protein ACTSWY_10385 [Promethearchaeota archaeon]
MSGKEIFGSVLISVIAMSAIIFFGLPVIFPNNENIVLQSKYVEISSLARIWDDQTASYQMVSGTQTNITVQENSRIYAEFSAVGLLSLGQSFNTKSDFVIALVIEGIGNRTIRLSLFDKDISLPGISDFFQRTYTIYIQYVSDPLPSGTYNISVQWISVYNSLGDHELRLSPIGGEEYVRSLFIQEHAT